MDDSKKRYGEATIAEAVKRLQSGCLVAVPTETVYGLAADSTNVDAVAAIYRTKGRPDFNPLIVHIPSIKAAQILGTFSPLAMQLAEEFWPGPLTLVIPKTPDCPVAPAITAGLDTIALRHPAHPVIQALLKKSDLYLAAPSANKSGGVSPTKAEHVKQSLGEASALVLDGGACQNGIESTIVAVRDAGYQILRPGPVTEEDLVRVTGQKPMAITHQKIEAPGQLSSHYAPSKPLRINVKTAKPDEYHIGFGEIAGDRNLSSAGELAEAAANLFALLHEADADKRTRIAVAPIPQTGIGIAINDRLKRAAT